MELRVLGPLEVLDDATPLALGGRKPRALLARLALEANRTVAVDRLVDSEQMYGTLDAIKATPELGVFQFQAQNRWIDGAHNRSTIRGFYGMHPLGANRAYKLLGDLALGRPALLH